MTKTCSKSFHGILLCCTIALSSNAMAETEAFTRAVKVFKKGYADCTEAQRIRSQDINQASEKFASYLELKEKSAKIDPRILTTNLHNISREIEFCQKAEQDILRSKAFPIMESALESCKTSKSQLAKSDYFKATSAYRKYEELYQQAITITPSIVRVSSVKLKVNRCDKLKSKIDTADAQLKKATTSFEAEHKAVTRLLATCNAEKKLISGNNVSKIDTRKAKSILKSSKLAIKKITKQRNQPTQRKLFSSHRTNQQVANKITSINKCHALLTAAISTLEINSRKNEAVRKQLAIEKLEKEKLSAERRKLALEKQRLALEKQQEAEQLERKKSETEAAALAEKNRILELNAQAQQRADNKAALKKEKKLAADEARKKKKAQLKKNRQSKDWSTNLGNENTENSKRSTNKNSGWQGLTK